MCYYDTCNACSTLARPGSTTHSSAPSNPSFASSNRVKSRLCLSLIIFSKLNGRSRPRDHRHISSRCLILTRLLFPSRSTQLDLDRAIEATRVSKALLSIGTVSDADKSACEPNVGAANAAKGPESGKGDAAEKRKFVAEGDEGIRSGGAATVRWGLCRAWSTTGTCGRAASGELT
jgi:hypothetical protein